MNYKREMAESIKNAIGKRPVVVLFGARQVGKTTLIKNIIKDFKRPLYIQCDEPQESDRITRRSVVELKALVAGHDVVVFDEAQTIQDIGTTLKLLADNTNVPIIATGSSSFELANKLSEPLTGRKQTFHLHPLSVAELVDTYGTHAVELGLEHLLLYGSYPHIVATESVTDKRAYLLELARDYLFKDVFMLGDIRNPFAFEKVVKLLALRVGSEVSYDEIAREAGVNRATVFAYVTLLERAFIVFRLTPWHTNKVKEIVKSHKIYFFDTGIRNAVIGNTDPVDIRLDKGALLENFFVAEKMKRWMYEGSVYTPHFWRARIGSEVDFVEVHGGGRLLRGFECKWRDAAQKPALWSTLYKETEFTSVTAASIIRELSTPCIKQ